MEKGEGKEGNVAAQKSYGFALRIVNMYRYLTEKQREYVLSKQVLRSGTAIGALYAECQHAQSKAILQTKQVSLLKKQTKLFTGSASYMTPIIFLMIYFNLSIKMLTNL